MAWTLVRNTFFVTAENVNHKKLTNIIGHNGKPLFVDTDFHKFEHSQQVATIYSKPLLIESNHNGDYLYDNTLQKGDTVIVHHHVCQKEKVVMDGDNKVFRCDYYNIMAKTQGGTNNKVDICEIVPLEKFVFVQPIVEPIKKSTTGLILTTHEGVEQGSGYVYCLSKQAVEAGIKKGDKVFYSSKSDYEIEILGVKLYRMRIRNIIAIERDGQLWCMNNKVLIMELPKKKTRLIMPDNSSEKDGVVVRTGESTIGIMAGDKVNFCYGVSERLRWNNAIYGAIDQKHINYKTA